ncbi:hypothetical protein ACROYT_G009414 [Oculina patagonica]
MGENIQRLKSCIKDLRNKIEIAEEKNRRATKVMKIKQQRFEVLWEDVTLKRRKLALRKETLQKTFELLEYKHEKLEEVDELLYTNAMISKELTDMEAHNVRNFTTLEVALKKTRAKAQEFENKTRDLKTRAQVYTREIQMAKIAEMKAERKRADLQSKLITSKGLLERLQAKQEEFHEREKDCIEHLHTLDEKVKEATTRAEAAERRSHLLDSKVSKLLEEINQQKSEAKKIFVLKNELEHLSLDY